MKRLIIALFTVLIGAVGCVTPAEKKVEASAKTEKAPATPKVEAPAKAPETAPEAKKQPSKEVPKQAKADKPAVPQTPISPEELQKLTTTRDELEAKRKTLQAQEAEARAKVAQSAALEDARKAADAAKQKSEQALAADEAVNAANAAEQAARGEVNATVARKLKASPEYAAVEKQVAETDAKRAELKFEQKVIDLQLSHEGSPVRREAVGAKTVTGPAQALAAAEKAGRTDPSKELAAAREALAKSRAELGALTDRLNGDSAVRGAAEAEQKAKSALTKAESDDANLTKLEKILTDCKTNLERVRLEVARKTPAAREYVEMLEKAAAGLKELGDQRKDIGYLLDAHREAILQTASDAVAKARAKVDAMQTDYEKALEGARDLANLKEAVDKAHQTFDTKYKSLFSTRAEYTALAREEEVLNGQVSNLTVQAMATTDANAVLKLLPQIRELRAKAQQTASKMRDIRLAVGAAEWNDIYNARGKAQRALDEKVDQSEKVSAMRKALADANAALREAVNDALANHKAAAALLEMRQTIDQKISDLKYREALAKLYLNGPESPVAKEIQANPNVAAAQGEVAKAEQLLKQTAADTLAKPRKALDEAQAAARGVHEKVFANADYRKAQAAVREAEEMVRKLEEPLKKAVEEARKAFEAAVQVAAGETRDGKTIVARKAQIQKELDELEAKRRDANGQVDKLRQALEKGTDADVTKAKEQAAAARKAVEAAANSQKLGELKKAADEAKKAIDAKRAALENEDAALQQVRKELSAVESELKAVNGKIRQAEKQQ